MPQMNMVQAINDALRLEMRRDPRAAEVVASIRTLIPGVGAPVEGFGGCA